MNNIKIDPQEKADLLIANIEYMRKKRGYNTMGELAKISGVSQSTLFRIVMGESLSPKIDTLYSLAEAFSVPWWTLTEIDYKKVDVDLIDFDALLNEQRAKVGITRKLTNEQCEVAVKVAMDAINMLPDSDLEISDQNQARLASAVAFYLSQTSIDNWEKVMVNEAVAHATQSHLLNQTV